MPKPLFRLIWEWDRYVPVLREAAKRRGWTEEQIQTALWRDRNCTIEVYNMESHLDWHEQLGLELPKFFSRGEGAKSGPTEVEGEKS